MAGGDFDLGKGKDYGRDFASVNSPLLSLAPHRDISKLVIFAPSPTLPAYLS